MKTDDHVIDIAPGAIPLLREFQTDRFVHRDLFSGGSK